jgi:hypothetical protein
MAGHGSGLLGFSVTFAVHLLASQFSKRPIISTAIAIIVIGTTLALPVVHAVPPPAPPAPTVPANWRSMP